MQRTVTCHGNRMKNPPWAIDLATVPKNDRRRFVELVTNGRNNMPPWGDLLNPEDVEALWAIFRPEKSKSTCLCATSPFRLGRDPNNLRKAVSSALRPAP